ncbi:MAG: flagellar biosynthesis protein FlhB [Firmicutes bacterium]|nr:flagellar biosynthesis protein FlhB [Bacillota bacterium]
MAGESKTEKATPKKRRDERKKGNVLMSRDAVPVATLFGGAVIIKALGGFIGDNIENIFFYNFSQIGQGVVLENVLPEVMKRFIIAALCCIGPVAGVVVLLAVSLTLFQTKLLVTTEPLKPKFKRLNPLEGVKRLVSLRSLVEALKNILKIGILLYLIYLYFTGMMGSFGRLLDMDLAKTCQILFDDAFDLVIQIGIAFLVLAFFDYLYQWWDFERQLKMSKEEIKEEYKQTEGDPKIKSKIKENQRKMAMSRMMQQVPEADVVIRNPTHFAVALRYKPEFDNAPIVLAKGMDALALRIVEVAETNQVAIVENVPLARALYDGAEINREIPPAFYGPVAEVLVYILKLDETMV